MNGVYISGQSGRFFFLGLVLLRIHIQAKHTSEEPSGFSSRILLQTKDKYWPDNHIPDMTPGAARLKKRTRADS